MASTKNERGLGNTVVVLHGDETGEELLQEALRVLDPALIGVDLSLQHYDLSLERRRATNNQVVEEAAEAILAAGFGLKAATITPEGVEDVGSPNLILRERLGAHVIVRTGRRIPGVRPLGGVNGPVTLVRMAVGGGDGANGRGGKCMEPRSGGKGRGWRKSPIGRNASPGAIAVLWRSMRSVTPSGAARKCSADPNTR